MRMSYLQKENKSHIKKTERSAIGLWCVVSGVCVFGGGGGG